ncbi:putative transcription factor interactor and regulator Znf-B family [Dioscorea sansibarensis]
MKIQCDVCTAEPASIFCCADEAALCSACDRRVHTANKLAGKHRRLSLSSSVQSPPLCDICQKRGLIFCQEDRAILCKDCDEPIHCANELTKKHNRFLLSSALRLSSTSMPEPTTTSSASTDTSTLTDANNNNNNNNNNGSSISDYLIKTLPGWRVEDLLDETMDDIFLMEESVKEDLQIWQAPQVPQAPRSEFSTHVFNLQQMETVSFDNFEFTTKPGRPEKRSSDDVFRVPQISTVNVENHKRSRTLNTNSSMPSSSSSFWYY